MHDAIGDILGGLFEVAGDIIETLVEVVTSNDSGKKKDAKDGKAE